ncbi:BZ3501_MvSof-1269-A2-R1_Chr7-1g08896 [Microbotryum saponariae]|nr:BZ3501_MvSof-1269-A2-R1_Chr7-1g08896 [Microbotryum saponariae]
MPTFRILECQKAERKSEHKGPVGGHHHGESAGKHDPDHKHKAKSADDHDHKHDHGPDDKDKHGHEGKHQVRGEHGDKPHARSNDKHDDAVRAVPSHVHEGLHKFSEGVSKHHGEQERTREPEHPGKHAVKSTTEQQGKHGVKPHAKHHDKHVGTVHSVPLNVLAGQHKFSTVPGQHSPYDDMPITQRHGKHGVEPDSKHHHGEHEHDHRGKKAPKDFKPEFVPAYKPTAESETHHGHDKGTAQHEGHGKTSAEAPHGAHGSDKKAPGTPKEGSKKQPEKQPRPAPKSGDKGNPSAKSAAGHAAETPKGGVTAAQCEAKALDKSKVSPVCHKDDLKCICTSQEYHGSLMRCGAAGERVLVDLLSARETHRLNWYRLLSFVPANTAAFEAGVDKYLHDCQKAGHPVAPLPKGKQGGKPQPGAHGEAGKNPASSNSTDQHPASGPPAALPKGKPGSEPQPGAQTEAGENPAGSNSTDQGPKDKEPAGASPADSNFPACAIPCISVAQKKTKTNCTTVACQCTDSVFQTQFTACMSQSEQPSPVLRCSGTLEEELTWSLIARPACNKVDYNKTIDVGKQACNAANNTTTGGDGSNNDNPNSNTNPGTPPPSTPGVQNNTSSAFGLRSSVGAVLAGAIGVAFATLL